MVKLKRGRPTDQSKKIVLTCPICTLEFTRYQSKVKKGTTPTCSKTCGDAARKQKMIRNGRDPNWRARVREGTFKGLRRARRKATKKEVMSFAQAVIEGGIKKIHGL